MPVARASHIELVLAVVNMAQSSGAWQWACQTLGEVTSTCCLQRSQREQPERPQKPSSSSLSKVLMNGNHISSSRRSSQQPGRQERHSCPNSSLRSLLLSKAQSRTSSHPSSHQPSQPGRQRPSSSNSNSSFRSSQSSSHQRRCQSSQLGRGARRRQGNGLHAAPRTAPRPRAHRSRLRSGASDNLQAGAKGPAPRRLLCQNLLMLRLAACPRAAMTGMRLPQIQLVRILHAVTDTKMLF